MREYFDHPSPVKRKKGIALPRETFAAEFRHVGYKFSGSDTEIYKDFNLTIKKGEKLAVVGPNGAGKTTFVKLLCGLYRPTNGEILIDGNPINAYNIDEYFTLFAAVFQDITVMPMTVKQNIACETQNIDEQRMSEAMRLSGFDEIADKLEKGADTYLVRGIYPDAVDLSGGETQRLALARALYRNGKFLILDEPTAALDPIAENYIYQQYNNISEGKTSVFISHRLASTRFCDRIVYIENGKIAESGTHDELMAKGGKYAELFEIQAHYYM
jgi:ABC-type multidrug transport system fused ATPase/permease subunit